MPLKKVALWTAKGLILAVILYFIFRNLQFRLLLESMQRIPVLAFVFALCVQAATQTLQAWRWKLLANDHSIPFREYLAFTCLGGTFSIISPATVLSDSVNAYLLGRRHQLIARSFISVFLGRVLGILSLGIFFLATLPSHAWIFHELRLTARPRVAALAAAGAIAALAVAAFLLFRRHRQRILSHLPEAIRIASDLPRLALGFAQSMAIQILGLFVGYLGFHFMQVPVTFGDVIFFGSIVTVLGLVPLTIGQVGVREGLNVLFYSVLPGVRKEHVLANIGYSYTLLVLATLLNFAAWQLLKEKR